jgi:hypothetical protein
MIAMIDPNVSHSAVAWFDPGCGRRGRIGRVGRGTWTGPTPCDAGGCGAGGGAASGRDSVGRGADPGPANG